MYFSRAIDIEGYSLLGALTSILKLALIAAF